MTDWNIPPEILAPPDAAEIEPVVRALEAGDPDLFSHPALKGWAVDTVGGAAWAMARIIEAKTTLDAVHAQGAAWHRAIHDWEAAASTLPSRTIDFFTPRLEAYALALRANSPLDSKGEPKIKKVDLPNGRIQTRKGISSYALTDEAALLAWAKVNLPDAVQVVEKVNLTILKTYTQIVAEKGAAMAKVLTADGEVVPGVWATIPEATATVTPEAI